MRGWAWKNALEGVLPTDGVGEASLDSGSIPGTSTKQLKTKILSSESAGYDPALSALARGSSRSEGQE